MIQDPYSLERTILESIPLARFMGISVLDYDGSRVALSAPLSSNVNDKGCAFGGSLASLMTLSAWGLVNLKLSEAGESADVYVADSQVSYLHPVWETLIAEAAADSGEDWDRFVADLRARGKARITVIAEVAAVEGGGIACRMSSKFVAKRSGL